MKGGNESVELRDYTCVYGKVNEIFQEARKILCIRV